MSLCTWQTHTEHLGLFYTEKKRQGIVSHVRSPAVTGKKVTGWLQVMLSLHFP